MCNQLRSISRDGNTSKYQYDAGNLRTQKSTATSSHTYQYDALGRQISEYQGGSAKTSTIWLGWQPIAQIDYQNSNSITYLTGDQLGSPRIGTNQAKQVVWRWNSDAFGTSEPEQDVDGDGTETIISNRFAGQYFDEESELYYNWNRYYDPETGRYVTSDPIGLGGGLNTFAYVYGNPLMYFDPYGLFRFGTRPLSGMPFKFNYGTNLNLSHENGFYSDCSNIGFFPEGIVPDAPENNESYGMFGPYYDDSIIEDAVSDLKESGKWNPEGEENGYDLYDKNCQDFADALRDRYKERGGKTCKKPFVNGKCPVVCKKTSRGLRCK